MNRYLIALGLACLLASPMVWAGGYPTAQDSSTPFRLTAVVYNDSGSTLTSGTVVIWDNDDTEFDDNGYPYVTTTTTADDDWVAGVMLTPSCPHTSLCEIVIYGPVMTICADATDASAEDTAVATTTVAGQCGDYGTGANTSSLGIVMEDDSVTGNDNEQTMVFVNPTQY